MNKASSYIKSYYSATANQSLSLPALQGDESADVCVIGGGYMGLSSALHLAERGYAVTLLEAERVSWGASGRNGGQCSIGQRYSQDKLEKEFGDAQARVLWDLSLEAVNTVRDLITRYSIDCDLKRGVLQAAAKTSDADWYRNYARHMQDHYGLDCQFIEGEELHEATGSRVFRSGFVEHESAHLHPLNYALGLAAAAGKKGVRLYENSRVLSYKHAAPYRVITEQGCVSARYVVLACNAYLGRLELRIAGKIMPINNFIIATEPLSERQRLQLNPQDLAMHDSKFVVNYWKLSEDGRMLFGGGENYTRRFPRDIKGFVRKYMLDVYPQLENVRIDYGWGGTLAVTMNRLPSFGRLEPDVYYAMGFSGHGVQMATLAGKLIAAAIAGTAEKFDVFARLPTPTFPGGTLLRWPGLVAAMIYYSLRDHFGD